MSQIYKVFINNFFLSFIPDSNPKNYLLKSIKFDYKLISSYRDLMTYLNSKNYFLDKNIIYITDSPLSCFKKFKSQFNFIVAAGGVVQNKHKDVLMIYKNQIWDLPKGKIENNENSEKTAIRELKEETNVEIKYINSQSFSTYHMYCIKSKIYLKETKWFLMSSNCKNELIPQISEGIKKVKWVRSHNLNQIKTYTLIKDVFTFFLNY